MNVGDRVQVVNEETVWYKRRGVLIEIGPDYQSRPYKVRMDKYENPNGGVIFSLDEIVLSSLREPAGPHRASCARNDYTVMTDEQEKQLTQAYAKLVRISNHVVMPRALRSMMETPLAEIREILQSATRTAMTSSSEKDGVRRY